MPGTADAAASVAAAAAPISTAASIGKSKRFGFTAETPPLESDSSRLYRARPRAARQHALDGLVDSTLFRHRSTAKRAYWLVKPRVVPHQMPREPACYRRRMRRLVILLSSIVALDIAFFAALTPLLPHFVSTYGLSKAAAGVLSASYAAGVLAASLPSGARGGALRPAQRRARRGLADGGCERRLRVRRQRLDARRARFLQGVGSALSWSGALAWLVAAAPRERRGELIGTTMGAAVFGALFGPVIGAIATVAGVRATFVGVGLLGVGAGRLGRRSRPACPPSRSRSRSSSAAPTAACSAGCGCWCCRRCCSACWPCSSRCGCTTRAGAASRSAPSSWRPRARGRCSTRCSGASPTGAATCCRCASR